MPAGLDAQNRVNGMRVSYVNGEMGSE